LVQDHGPRVVVALSQVSGEALYCDDIDVPADTLEGALVLSTRPNARILSFDASAALAVDGVVAVVTAKDIPGA
jgi:xanthine dehydrogenase molybdopterin-binding subunit B